MGIPRSYADREIEYLHYDKVLNVNIDGRVPIEQKYNSSIINIPIEVDYTERKYIHQYYTIGDIMSAIGGINAFFRPIVSFLAPIWIIIFLSDLSRIFQEKNQHNYYLELNQFLEFSKNLLIDH